MRPTIATNRRGTSLMEVLISMLVMVIGITSVISLFPVGVLRIRQAVMDTRCTMLSQNAKQLIVAKQMPNDPALVRLDEDVTGGTNGIYAQKLDAEANNVYAWLVGRSTSPPLSETADPDLFRYLLGSPTRTQATPGGNDNTTFLDPAGPEFPVKYPFQPSEAVLMSYPILVDPWLYETYAPSAANGPARIKIRNYYSQLSPPLNSPTPYYDIRVCSLAEIHGAPLAPLTAVAPVNALTGIGGTAPLDIYRGHYITRWFSSLGDVKFTDANAVIPLNPNRTSTFPQYQQLDYRTATNLSSAERQYNYTWAFMIQRPLGPDNENGIANHVAGNRSVARPSRDFSQAKINVLCFHRRNLATADKAYKVVEGCIYDGSKKITLSWPQTVARPEIKRNMWLCEASIASDNMSTVKGAANRRSGNYKGSLWTYRRDFNFFKVVDYSEPIISGNRIFQEVTVDRTPTGYPSRNAIGDLRGPDTNWVQPEWPVVNDYDANGRMVVDANYLPLSHYGTTAGAAPVAVFYPILIFDGLMEVF